MATEASRRTVKRKSTASVEEPNKSGKHIRKCERTGCPAKSPICFASALDRCAGNGYTSRWYHLSQAEHYCNECFDHFYRSHKDGYETFAVWKRKWSKYGTTDPNIKTFMSETMMPYWVECTKCQKWRQLSKDCNLTSDFVRKYVCGMSHSGEIKPNQSNACDSPEDYRVEYTGEYAWITQLVTPPYLKNSPAFPFLTSYFPDGVGMSPTDMESNSSQSTDMPQHLSPFVSTEHREPARCFQPDAMDEQETSQFPEFSKIPHLYLAMRNICVTLWNLDPKKWLSHQRCASYVLCRGMTRIWCINRLHSILWFLTRRGLINFGLLSVPKEIDFMPENLFPPDKHVLIIGAGIAGLSTAHHLQRFGIKTTVLEANSNLGGRIRDVQSLGKTMGLGAQSINGTDNNPLTVLSYQVGANTRELNDKCCLLKKGGQKVDEKTDAQMDFHFNAVLDIIADWRRNRDNLSDQNLLEKVKETHQHFMDESQIHFTKEQETLFNFHIGNLEYALGTSLTNISTLHWDQNEDYPQFSGKNCLFIDGLTEILQKLAEPLDIIYDTKITDVNYTDEVTVISSDGNRWVGDKVVVTVPLSQLKKRVIKFTPELPQSKITAIDQIGVGYMEKVILKFKDKFWSNYDMFGRVEPDFDRRGLFGVFQDMSTKDGSKQKFILGTHISGNCIELMKEKTDEEIVEMCVETLSELFPKKKIPKPDSYLVTRWYKEPNIEMAYSHMPVGAKGDNYDNLAAEVNERVFFAGEATNRQHPQSVTGAYLSGIREAEKIMFSLAPS